MSLEAAIQAYLQPILNTLTPAVPLQWGVVPAGLDEYVEMSTIPYGQTQIEDDFTSERKQLTVVTKISMVRAGEVRDLLKTHLQRMKGVFSGVEIQCCSFVYSVDLPNPTTGESIITSDYQFNYQEVF